MINALVRDIVCEWWPKYHSKMFPVNKPVFPHKGCSRLLKIKTRLDPKDPANDIMIAQKAKIMDGGISFEIRAPPEASVTVLLDIIECHKKMKKCCSKIFSLWCTFIQPPVCFQKYNTVFPFGVILDKIKLSP